jgi:hypothetical protein
MTEISPLPVSTLRLVLAYLAAFVGATVLFYIIIVVMAELFNVEFQNSAMGFIVAFVSANYVGQFWYSREANLPVKGRIWKITLLCALITLALSGLIFWGVYHLIGLDSQASLFSLSGDDATIIGGFVVGLVLLQVLVIRFGIGMGLKQAAKLQAQKLAKSGS